MKLAGVDFYPLEVLMVHVLQLTDQSLLLPLLAAAEHRCRLHICVLLVLRHARLLQPSALLQLCWCVLCIFFGHFDPGKQVQRVYTCQLGALVLLRYSPLLHLLQWKRRKHSDDLFLCWLFGRLLVLVAEFLRLGRSDPVEVVVGGSRLLLLVLE